MKETILLECCGGARSEIIIGSAEENLDALLPVGHSSVVIITDANTHLYNREFVDAHKHIVIGQGETAKTLRTVEETYRKLLELEADRSTFLIGMGGGIITDITGFVAGTFMRGIGFGLIPTTLLAQVDAGIGGKNGVNLDGYKNIVGLILQPGFVICDPAKLLTLPEREFHSGLAEVIKAAIIGDRELFAIFEKHTAEEIRTDGDLLHEVITRAIKVKTNVVRQDEMEKGERRKLNLGHTFAHAVEKHMQGVSHGEAVAAGTVEASRWSLKLGMLSAADHDRIVSAISKAGLPTGYPIEQKKLFSAIKHDKKRESDTINIVLPTSIGNCEVMNITLDEFERLIDPA